jgi:alkylated DNA repair dioxygenase AlkB
MAMLDLFDAPVLPGLAARPGLVDGTQERALIGAIDATDLTPFRFQGWTGKRLTTSFGFNYDFETQRLARAAPIADWLLDVRAQMAAFAGIEPNLLIQALLIRYDPGAGIGWHRDRPVFEHVVGISLGAPATLRLRRRTPVGFDRAAVPLAPRTPYHLSGEARHVWEHSIAPMAEPRWSITFRSFSAKAGASREAR